MAGNLQQNIRQTPGNIQVRCQLKNLFIRIGRMEVILIH